MTPAEVAAILRQFNEWRRSDYEPSEQPAPPDPREIGEAIDSAIEMIDRLEATEADGLEQARLNGMSAEREAALLAKLEAADRERDALRAKIEAMAKQEPVGGAGAMPGTSGFTMACFRADAVPFGSKLYALPGAHAQPTPSDEYVGWYCAHCQRGVAASEVTYHEQHEV